MFFADCYDHSVSTYTFCFEDFVNKAEEICFYQPFILSTYRTRIVASVNSSILCSYQAYFYAQA